MRNDDSWKRISMYLKRVFFVWIAVFLLAGCGNNLFEGIADDSSYEALIEEARIALDNGDYNKAKDILLGMDQSDSTVLQYLSNAYAGLAGLDTFSLLETIDTLTSNSTGDIDMVGKVLGGDDATLSLSEMKSKREDLDNAIAALNDITSSGGTLTDEQKVQLGILSVNAGILLVGEIVSEANGSMDIVLTDTGILNQPLSTPTSISSDDVETFSDYVGNIANAAAEIVNITSDPSNDLSININQFVTDVGGNSGVSGVTEGELLNYITNDLLT